MANQICKPIKNCKTCKRCEYKLFTPSPPYVTQLHVDDTCQVCSYVSTRSRAICFNPHDDHVQWSAWPLNLKTHERFDRRISHFPLFHWLILVNPVSSQVINPVIYLFSHKHDEIHRSGIWIYYQIYITFICYHKDGTARHCDSLHRKYISVETGLFMLIRIYY